MPTSNFLIFDQNKANMIGDEAYQTSTQRLNGVQSGVASSMLNNKFAYQVSLVAYAIAQIMNQNGIDATDTMAVSQFVNNLSSTFLQKVVDKASVADAIAASSDSKWMSPKTVKSMLQHMGSGWQLLQKWETAGTYTWTAPDLLGNGQPYEIGILLIGGGGSGGIRYRNGYNSSYAYGANNAAMTEFKINVTPGEEYTLKVGSGATNSLVKSGSLGFDDEFSSGASYNCTPSEILDSEGNMIAVAIAASSSYSFLSNSTFTYGSVLYRGFGRDNYGLTYPFDFLSPFGNICSFDGLTYMSPGVDSERSTAKRLPSTPENIVLSPAYNNTSAGVTFNYTAPGKPSFGSGSSGIFAMHRSGNTKSCSVNIKSQPGGGGLVKIFVPSLL